MTPLRQRMLVIVADPTRQLSVVTKSVGLRRALSALCRGDSARDYA